MQRQASQTPSSSAYLAAKARYERMTPEQRAAFKADYERQRAQRERAVIMAGREQTVKGRIAASGIPLEYRDATVRHPAIRQWVDAVKAGAGGQLVLRGTNGTGKTTQACGALMELAQVMTVRFATLDAIQRAVSGSWIDRVRSPSEVLAAYTTCGCLLVDDLGQTALSERTTAMLLQIMSERIGNGKPTVYTTNYEGQGLYRRLAEKGNPQHAMAIMDRLKACTPVEMTGPSMRKRIGWGGREKGR